MEWLPFYYAVSEIKRELRVSSGKAKVILRQLCSTGEIHSQKRPYLIVNWQQQWQTPEPEPIEPREWRDHQIDMMTDSNGLSYSVDVEKSDFKYWLDRNKPIGKQQKGAVGKVPRILKLLVEIFKGEPVPDPAFCRRDDLRADLLKRAPSLNPLNKTTLKTAIDTYNANLKRS